jgi:hypothetical protein
MGSPWRPVVRHEDIPPGGSLVSIRQFLAGTPMAWSSSHHTFTSFPLHLNMPRFSPTAFVHWTRSALFHNNGFLHFYKPRDGRSTPLFRRAGILWSRIVVFEDRTCLLFHSVSFIVWYVHIPFCFHCRSRKIHRFHIELYALPKHHRPNQTLNEYNTAVPVTQGSA